MSRRSVEVMFLDGCPHVDLALRHVHAAIASTGLDGAVDVALTRIEDDAEAVRKRFLGSPTVHVDGLDVEPDAACRREYGLHCRLYWDDGRVDGAPPRSLIAAALIGPPPVANARAATGPVPCAANGSCDGTGRGQS
jgi:hypothetical protein